MEFSVGQVIKTETPIGTFVGVVEAVNPTHSREGRAYGTDMPSLTLFVPGLPDSLWIPQSWAQVYE